MDKLNYEQDVEIDPNALDVECLRQASLFYQYSRAEADAKRNHALAWENLKVVRSGLILNAGKEYSNAQKVEAYYRDHPDHQEAKKELAEAEYQMNLASAACFSMRQRKDMLENLTRLALSDYFARPSEPRDLPNEAAKRETRTEKVRDRASERLSRRSRE